MTLRHVALPAGLALVLASGVFADEKPAPVDVGLEERIEVRLVLIDVLVLDRSDRTVPDLAAGDFELLVDGKPVEVETLDRQCPLGIAEDARPEEADSRPSERPSRPPGSGRIVLVFDTFHMQSADPGGQHLQGGSALRAAADAIESGRLAASEIMVLSLGEVMRIEASFTADRAEVLHALDRMGKDPALYSGRRGLTEFRFFDRILALLDLLEAIPGRKAVVLFSGPIGHDGWTHDVAYRQISAMSATSRTAIYPVDTGGLRTPLDPDAMPLGGPPMLRRLAVETGGRMTADTNDLTLGPARAGRDLGCTYTLGFHDREPRHDRSRRLTVLFPERKGLRAVYPASYVVRSPEERARSLLDTASMAPESFRSDSLWADLILSRPCSTRRWEATLTVEICLPPGTREPPAERDLRGFVRTPTGTMVHSFERRIAPKTEAATVLEELHVRPGRYVLSAVLSDPEGGAPLAAVREVVVPEMPRDASPLVLLEDDPE